MEDNDLIFGLAKRHYLDMLRVFDKFPHVERVLIFGSRAKGVAKPYSDIDLAVVAPEMDEGEFSRLLEALEALELVFKLDVVHLDKLNQPKLRESILAHGKNFYPL
jgi:uncharacterized protein